MVFGPEAFGRQLGHQGGALVMRLTPLYERDWRERTCVSRQEAGLNQTPDLLAP